jgi:superfamily II DNA or RNA helicase
MAMTRRSLARLSAWFLLCEDPQRRLDAQPVSTLAHQASLVRHILSSKQLERVLIGDEVGLGKTVEAGLIIRELLEQEPARRILYLAPARLVSNVATEFDRLGLAFRQWVSGEASTASLADSRIIASIHRAVHSAHFEKLVGSEPWDVIVVDECHHLSDWAPGGGSPLKKYQLVRDLIDRQGPNGRVLLLSGTPHQGHMARFENLLRLLKRKGESDSDAAKAGRVVFRTKEDVRDWEGKPLFPSRQVNPAFVIDLGPRHQAWLEQIHDFYAGEGGPGQRAAGWRLYQALQWASSSVQAGLGFMIRQAIRAGWASTHPTLRSALCAIRPYRRGSPDEPPEALYARMREEVARQGSFADVDDIEELEEEAWQPDSQKLDALLVAGLDLLTEARDKKWDEIHDRLLRDIGTEKVVLFAQPIETVTALVGYLERRTGSRPAIIIGSQSAAERTQEVARFWATTGPQFLVSSRAGGEGLNLQVSRRLIHVDVPWNPMELEQRIGRVHRFGSRKTVIVDTVVVKKSREEHAYRIAREKLKLIAGTMVSEDRFETLFMRVMSLLPPAELSGLLGDRPLAPLTTDERAVLSDLVSTGFAVWKAFDERFGPEQRRIKELNPGRATWGDVYRFAMDQAAATPATGFEALSFRLGAEEVEEDNRSAPAVRFKDAGPAFACGDFSGMPVSGANGERAQPLGLNVGPLAAALRLTGLPSQPTGAAHVRWPEGTDRPPSLSVAPCAVLILVRQSIRRGTSAFTGVSDELLAWTVRADRSVVQLGPDELAMLIRVLPQATLRREVEDATELIAAAERQERLLTDQLRKPTEQDRAERVAHAVVPLFCGIIW